MDIPALLALYDAEVRAKPAAVGVTVERVGRVVRLTGGFNFISAWTLTRETVVEEVAAQAAEFRRRGEALIWRVYSHDGPAELPAALAANGFEAEAPGTLMFFDLTHTQDAADAPGVEVLRRVRNLAALDDFAWASDTAFEDDEASRRKGDYAERLGDPELALFVAYVDGAVAASARVETQPGRPFALMFGGGVAPAHRGRGAYRALVAARATEARRRGAAYLSTEAQETSRPILQKLGFIPVVSETTWVLSAPAISRN